MQIRWMAVASTLALVGCAGAPADEEETPSLEQGDPVPTLARQTTGNKHFIHVAGLCSTGWIGGKGGGRLANFADMVSVDSRIDQRDSMAVAVPQMRAVLDDYCTGNDVCFIYTHSNGGAVVGKTLALYNADYWNIAWVLQSASNQGGSELSGSFTATVGDTLGLTCNLGNDIGPADHRPAWNHNDTGGNTFYMIGGYDEWWYTGSFPDFFDGMANDGALSYHSAGGLNDTYFISDDDPWLCFKPEYHYANHEIAWSCKGYDLDHDGMKMKGISLLGG